MRGTAGTLKPVYREFAGFIIDIEGVLIRGETPIPGAAETIAHLNRLKKKSVYLSNISDQTRAGVARKLVKLGFAIEPRQIITAAYAAVLYLKITCPGVKNVFMIGTDSLREELTGSGFQVVSRHPDAEAVLIGLDYDLNYLKMCEAAKAIKNGSLFIASNLAKIKLTDDGYTVGPGFTVKGLEFVTGQEAVLVGKPSPFMFELALTQLELEPRQILTIGDKLEEDIKGGHLAGTSTCLVMSGDASQESLTAEGKGIEPTFVVENISRLLVK
jgi:HAD superfamily hydrolase (TIGR01450 family)